LEFDQGFDTCLAAFVLTESVQSPAFDDAFKAVVLRELGKDLTPLKPLHLGDIQKTINQNWPATSTGSQTTGQTQTGK